MILVVKPEGAVAAEQRYLDLYQPKSNVLERRHTDAAKAKMPAAKLGKTATDAAKANKQRVRGCP